MLLPGTQMHIVTFIFVCIEIVIVFYLFIFKIARPDNEYTTLNIILIALLLTYNITTGLLPDPQLAGSKFLQKIVAYGTGFITPCFFPYYVFKVFGFKKMKFHVKKGVLLFLFLLYVLFVFLYKMSGNLSMAKCVLGLPMLYAIWVIYSLVDSIRDKFSVNKKRKNNKEGNIFLLSIVTWIGLAIVAYFDLNQATEACITNVGFLLFLTLQISRHIQEIRIEHERLQKTEKRLLHWNGHLQDQVNKRTRVLEKIIQQRTNTFLTLAHETRTPLTLIQNCIEEYINKNGTSEELVLVKSSLLKLSIDIINLFDIEKHNRGILIYNHDQVCNFSQIIKDQIFLFKKIACKRNIRIDAQIQQNIFIKADPFAVTHLVNNIIENAIKFSFNGGEICTELKFEKSRIIFIVRDNGVGIPENLKEKVFEPYFQISHHKHENPGMGLGLPLVKKIVEELEGVIEIEKNSTGRCGTVLKVSLTGTVGFEGEPIEGNRPEKKNLPCFETLIHEPNEFEKERSIIMLVEDNVAMAGFLGKKLNEFYNVTIASNGNQALQILKNGLLLPDLIISDIVMGKLDGFHLAKIIGDEPAWNHIPVIFISGKCNPMQRLEGLRSGAIDFIQKPFLIEEVYRKIESVLRIVTQQESGLRKTWCKGSTYKPVKELEKGISYDKCDEYHLSRRERDIVKLISKGVRYKEIGEALFISVRTVTTHAQNIFEKVGVKNKIELLNKLHNGKGI